MNIKYLSFGTVQNYQSILLEIRKSFTRSDTLQKPEKNATVELKNNYYLQKIELENDWMKHLVDKTVALVEQKLVQEMSTTLHPSQLYIFMLPELWMCVPEDLGKSTVTLKPTGYHRPFINVVVRSMLENSAYHSLTKKYPNLLFCPGTVWWKDMYQNTTGVHEVYFQSAPVFWQGNCIAFWDKQTLSDKDGAGPVAEMGSKVRKWMDYRKEVMGLENTLLDANEMMIRIKMYLEKHGPIRSTIGKSYEQTNFRNNVFLISIGLQTVSCSIEICLDCCYGITQAMKVNQPDIQLITSFQLGFIFEEMSYTNSYTLWCDGEYGSFVYDKKADNFIALQPDIQMKMSQFAFEV